MILMEASQLSDKTIPIKWQILTNESMTKMVCSKGYLIFTRFEIDLTARLMQISNQLS